MQNKRETIHKFISIYRKLRRLQQLLTIYHKTIVQRNLALQPPLNKDHYPGLPDSGRGLYMGPNNLCYVTRHFLLLFSVSQVIFLGILLRQVAFYNSFIYVFIL